jgi:hypothetical protein
VITKGLTVAYDGIVVTGNSTVTGNLYIAGTMTHTSDRRLKTNLQPLTNSLAKVSRLRGVYYSWKADSMELIGVSFDNRRHVGLIAQDVQQVLPEVVTEMHQGEYLGVDYSGVMPLLVESIRELDYRTKSMLGNEIDDSEKQGKRLVKLEWLLSKEVADVLKEQNATDVATSIDLDDDVDDIDEYVACKESDKVCLMVQSITSMEHLAKAVQRRRGLRIAQMEAEVERMALEVEEKNSHLRHLTAVLSNRLMAYEDRQREKEERMIEKSLISRNNSV